MRRLIVCLVLLAACKKSPPTVHLELPPPSGPTEPQPAPAAATPAIPTPAEPTPELAPARTTPPTLGEVRPLLMPLFASIKACVKAQGAFDAAAVRPELQVRVEPAGEVFEAAIAGLPGAHECAREAMKKLRLPAWSGPATIIAVPLQGTGDPLMVSGDGGA